MRTSSRYGAERIRTVSPRPSEVQRGADGGEGEFGRTKLVPVLERQGVDPVGAAARKHRDGSRRDSRPATHQDGGGAGDVGLYLATGEYLGDRRVARTPGEMRKRSPRCPRHRGRGRCREPTVREASRCRRGRAAFREPVRWRRPGATCPSRKMITSSRPAALESRISASRGLLTPSPSTSPSVGSSPEGTVRPAAAVRMASASWLSKTLSLLVSPQCPRPLQYIRLIGRAADSEIGKGPGSVQLGDLELERRRVGNQRDNVSNAENDLARGAYGVGARQPPGHPAAANLHWQ